MNLMLLVTSLIPLMVSAAGFYSCEGDVMPRVYGPPPGITTVTGEHYYRSVVVDEQADVVIAAGYTNFDPKTADWISGDLINADPGESSKLRVPMAATSWTPLIHVYPLK